MEIQIWHQAASSVGEGLRKGTVVSASTSIWEKDAPPGLTLMPDNSVPPHMSLVPFELLPQWWTLEGISLSKLVCGPFKRNCLGLQKPSALLSHNPCWSLEPEIMRTSLPGTGTLSFRVWYTPGVDLRSQDIPPGCYPPHVDVGPALSASLPLPPVSMCFFLISLVVKLSFNWIIGGSEWWLFS